MATVNKVDDNKTDADKVADSNPLDDRSVEVRLLQNANGEVANDPNEGLIVHNERKLDGTVKVHGPMARSEWAKYSKENGL